MKKIFIAFLTISLVSVYAASAQTGSKTKGPLGKWKFEAPYAPEGYNTGTIEISFAENKYSTAISLSGADFIIPGDKTKLENDTLSFSVMIDTEEVVVKLKAENETKMTGKAVYSEGEIPLTLTKDVPEK
jgi:hypothetical protein